MKQHFIPESYIKRFLISDSVPDMPKERSVYIYNKKLKNWRFKTPAQICYLIDFHNIDLENYLSRIEYASKPILDKIQSGVQVALNAEEKNILEDFCITLWLRNPGAQDMIDENLSKINFSGKYDSLPELTSEERVELAYEHRDKIKQHFQDLHTYVLQLECNEVFITSDDPFIRVNQLGPAQPKVEILIPISPKACLVINKTGINPYIDVTEINSIIYAHARDIIISDRKQFVQGMPIRISNQDNSIDV
jgi:hypothetical protein